MKKRLIMLLSAVLIINTLTFGVFSEEIPYDQVEPVQNEEGDSDINMDTLTVQHDDASMDNTDIQEETITPYTITATFGQTLGRKHADNINKFRTSDTWIYKPDGSRKQITGLRALTYDYGLEKIATLRAVEAAFRYAHYRPDDSECYDAYRDLYPSVDIRGAKGENLAYNYGKGDSEAAVLKAFKEEDQDYSGQGHRRNMLDPGYTYIGVGHVIVNGTHYWAHEFSNFPVSATQTAPIDVPQSVTVKVLDSLIGNEVKIPKTKSMDASDNITAWDFSIYGASAHIGYKNKLDISGGFPTASVNGTIKKKKFVSSDKKIVKVNNKGMATGGKKAGEAHVTMYAKIDKSKEWQEVGTVEVKNTCPVMVKNATATITSTVSANNWLSGTDEPVLGWVSSKPDVATVAEDGTVTALKKGKTKIYPVFIFGKSKAGTNLKVKSPTR